MTIAERPHCQRCEALMEFQRIDPGVRGFENQVFECGRCYTMKTVSVRIHHLAKRSEDNWSTGAA